MELDILLNMTVGQVRELIAYADGDEKLKDFCSCVDDDDLEKVGYDPYEDEEEDYDEDEEDDDLFDEDEDEDEDTSLDDPDEEALAQSIADDIGAGRYTLNAISGLYPEHIVARIEELA